MLQLALCCWATSHRCVSSKLDLCTSGRLRAPNRNAAQQRPCMRSTVCCAFFKRSWPARNGSRAAVHSPRQGVRSHQPSQVFLSSRCLGVGRSALLEQVAQWRASLVDGKPTALAGESLASAPMSRWLQGSRPRPCSYPGIDGQGSQMALEQLEPVVADSATFNPQVRTAQGKSSGVVSVALWGCTL